MGVPLVLLYNLDSPKGAKIRRMCLPLKIRTRSVPKESYGQTLAALAEGAEITGPYTGPDFDDEMAVLVDFDSAGLTAFLQGFRRNKIPPVALKAVLTPTNSGWDSPALREELMREREALSAGSQADHGTGESGL